MKGRLIADRYRLGDPLGAGGMSSVWKAEDLELGRQVAVKLLAPDADRARFEREARAAASLAHPNICALYDFGETGDGPYMVLELLPGGSLDDRLAGDALPDAETERIARGLAAGLAHAHDRGLVHRDLKPANILFDAEDRPKIADFGIVRAPDAGTLTEAGTVLGTAATISPEQAGGGQATPASDVYSFGVVLYWMLTGRPPFLGSDPMAIVERHLREQPPPLASLRPDVPARLESVATAALAKDPADRPADGRALLAELEGVAAAASTLVVAPAAAAPPTPRAWPVRAALVAALLLLLGAGGLVALVATQASEREPNPLPPVVERTRGEDTTVAESTATQEQTTEAGTTQPAVTTEPTPTTTELPPTTGPPLPTDSLPVTTGEPSPTTTEGPSP